MYQTTISEEVTITVCGGGGGRRGVGRRGVGEGREMGMGRVKEEGDGVQQRK